MLVVAIAACTPSVQDRPTPAVWQPFGHEGVRYGKLALAGDGVWFIGEQYPAPSSGTLFLTKTNIHGQTIVPETNVEGPGPLYLGWTALVPTDAGLTISFMRDEPHAGDHPYVRVFDHAGVASSAAHRVPVVIDGSELGATYSTALATAGDGHVRLLTTYPSLQQVALVDLDGAGNVTGTNISAGTPDGGSIGTIAATTLADDSTLIAWDYVHDVGHGDTNPARTITEVVDSAWNPGATAVVGADPDRGDVSPALASRDGATFVAWQSVTQTAGLEKTSIARYPDFDAAIELPAWQPPALALADAHHGVAASVSEDGVLQIQAFDDASGALVLGDMRTVDPIDADPATWKSLAGVTYLDGHRYLVAWEEQPQDWSHTRLYATIVNFDAADE